MMQHQPQKTGLRNTSFISGLLLQIILASVYFAFRFIAEFGRGAKHPALHAIISAILFFAIYHSFCVLYKEFQKLNSSFRESAVSHIISLLLSDAMLWLEAWQTWPKADAPFITLVLIPLLFQSTVVMMYLAVVVPELLKRTVPEDALLVIGNRPNEDVNSITHNIETWKPADPARSFLEQLARKQDVSFRITETISEDVPLPDLFAGIERNSAVILYEVTPDTRAALIRYCNKTQRDLYFTPEQSDFPLLGSAATWLTDSVLMKRGCGTEYDLQQTAKRFMDIVISAGLLILLSPFMLITACAILLEDGGPVIFTQRRYTLNGKVFEILKFRTMQKSTGDDGVHPYTKNDRRVTRVGRILRRLHLDELPQLVNILKGDMSLVGPRPEQVELADLYTEYLKEYPERLRVRAGLTGLAQVYGRYSIEPPDKLRDDLLYIEKQSILLDLKILMLTAVSIFRKDGTEGFEAEQSEKLHAGADELASRGSDLNLALTRDRASDTANGALDPHAGCDEGTDVFPAGRSHKLANWFSWIEAHLQWGFYPLLLAWCSYDLLGRIKWITGKETVRAIRTVLMNVMQPGVWFLLAITVIVFIGTGLTATDKSEQAKRTLERIFCYPFAASLVITLFGVYLIHTFSKTILMEILLILLLLSGYAQGRRTAAFLFGFFAFGTMFGVLSWILHLSEDFILVFNYGVCHSLGFVNPNSFGLYIFMTFVFWWFLADEKNRRRVFIVGCVIAVLCFMVSGCRTATALILFLVICSCCLMDLEVQIPRKAINRLITFLPVLMFVLSVLTGVTLYQIDKVFHSNFIVRVVDFVYAIEDKGLSLFPQSFNDTERYYYFDTGYYAWIFRRGLLASIGLLLPMMRLNRLVSVRGGRKNIMLLLCAGLYFCMEGVDILLVMPLLAFAGVFIESGSFEG